MRPYATARLHTMHAALPWSFLYANEESISKVVCKGSGDWLILFFIFFEVNLCHVKHTESHRINTDLVLEFILLQDLQGWEGWEADSLTLSSNKYNILWTIRFEQNFKIKHGISKKWWHLLGKRGNWVKNLRETIWVGRQLYWEYRGLG